MKAIELVDLIYKRKKDGSLSKFSKRILEKHNLTEDSEIDTISCVLISSDISNKEKRKEVLEIIMKKEKISYDYDIDIRELSYKKVCKIYHPDNLNTGNIRMFKFIQEIKEYLWDYIGRPRKEINCISWDFEKKQEDIKSKLTKEQLDKYYNMAFFEQDIIDEFVEECMLKNKGVI